MGCLWIYGVANTGKTTYLRMAESIFPSCELDVSTVKFQEIQGDYEKALIVTMNDPEPDQIVCKEMTQNFKNLAEGRGMNANVKCKGKLVGILKNTSILVTTNSIPNVSNFKERV